MLMYRRTSLLESSAQTLVNTVNCVGVMGKGIAREFKERDPQMFAAYKRICDAKKLEPGLLWLWRGEESWILNFPTKLHWRNPSKIEWIEAGLKKFASAYEKHGIREISFPRLGCGNGGLDWKDVRPLMEEYLSPLPIQIYIHDYQVDIGIPEHLEYVSRKLVDEKSSVDSFDEFLYALHRAVELSNKNLVDLKTMDPISAKIANNDELIIDTGDDSWIFADEDLRGVWLGLRKGLLTKEKAGWSTGGGGKPLLSILSLLPDVRPIEIQSIADNEPQLAVEFRPSKRGNAQAPDSGKQFEMSWR